MIKNNIPQFRIKLNSDKLLTPALTPSLFDTSLYKPVVNIGTFCINTVVYKSSSHCHTKEKRKTVIIIGFALERKTFIKAVIVFAPSTYAASSNSLGNPLKYCRKINMYNPFFKPVQVIPNIKNGVTVSSKLRGSPEINSIIPKISKYLNLLYSGNKIKSGGIIIPKRTIKNNRFFPLKSNLANPYATQVAETV